MFYNSGLADLDCFFGTSSRAQPDVLCYTTDKFCQLGIGLVESGCGTWFEGDYSDGWWFDICSCYGVQNLMGVHE